ncbi:hypothetical protein A8C32_08640 [Flavivirga aquatica]|uniref:Tetratricopeptide repeat protein n=1 Tax=Flavivirga aquatica TaxID=1849968 RepID=A0A1E5SJB6_9FLAO|nr:hypothetical protein [Flavivirga aquatica]OEJ99227.1 hypothetical protein A8C32_08640 [Flavivirga aquatica]
MNLTDFTHILQHPQVITHEQTEAVKSIIEEFPYFQPARAIYLKGLKDLNSFKYNQELKTTAAYTTDRSILFEFITSDAFVQNEISQFIKQNDTSLKDIEVDIEDISVQKNVTIDDILKQQIKDTDGVLDPTLFQPKEERPKKTISNIPLDKPKNIINSTNEETKSQEKRQEIPANDVLNLGKPFEFNKKETHSFNEWLKLTHFSPIERPEDEEKEDNKEKEEIKNDNKIIEKEVTKKKTTDTLDKEKKFQLIDQFIIKNPKIRPIKPITQKGNLAKAQMIQPESLMTETLARIYVEQKNYKKAIQSYKVLSLKYPEKSGLFANQIKAIEQLQEQNNKE